MELVRHFSPETYARALEDWAWLLEGRAFVPIASSPFGDTFLQAPDGVWYLDMLEGSLSRQWSDTGSLEAELTTEKGQDQFLLAGLAIGANARGVTPAAGEVLMFSLAPVLGGPIEVGNIQTMDYVVASTISAQLHRQIKDLPAGTRISGFTVEDSSN